MPDPNIAPDVGGGKRAFWYLPVMFNVRWHLGLYGYDPCDEWDIDFVLGLPDGLYYQDGCVKFRCLVCDAWTEWPAEPDDFDIDNDSNVCGGSPRCCP